MVHWDNNMAERDVIIFSTGDTPHCPADVYPTAIRGVGDPSNVERSARVSKFHHGDSVYPDINVNTHNNPLLALNALNAVIIVYQVLLLATEH